MTDPAKRVQKFIDARRTYRSRFPKGRNPVPDRITAEYGYLDINDLQALVNAAKGKT